MRGGNRVGFSGRIDTIQPTVGRARAGQRRIDGELHSLEAIILQTLIARQPFESRPDGIGTQVNEVIEVEIDLESRGVSKAIVEKARFRFHQNSS